VTWDTLYDDSCPSGVASNAIVAEICIGGATTLAMHRILNFWPWRVAATGAAQMTASDAKWTIAENIPSAIDSEWIKKDVRCMKYEMKKLEGVLKGTISRSFQKLYDQLKDAQKFDRNGKIELISALFQKFKKSLELRKYQVTQLNRLWVQR
jgi:hypothetical protein